MRILVVEDQEKLAKSVKKGLESEGFAVDILHNGREGLGRIRGNATYYDLIVLDILLPEVSGLEILTTIRKEKIHTPVLLLTALETVDDRVIGLDAGADDYLPKPFVFSELSARVRALLRRPKQEIPDVITLHDIILNTKSRTVTKSGRAMVVTGKEFSILEYMMRNPDQVLSREQIMNHVWDYSFDSFSNVVDVHIKNLRKKLQKKDETIFQTIHGVGYTFVS